MAPRLAPLLALAAPAAVHLAAGCEPNQYPAPKPEEKHEDWLATLQYLADEIRNKSDVKWEVYDVKGLEWTRTNYIQTQVHLFDLYLYNGTHYTVDRYLDDLDQRYGGIDSVLLWVTYPNLGIDERNQLDYSRAVPGGIDAFTEVTEAFHRRGVKVLWGFNPWDQATRDEGEPSWVGMAKLLNETSGDGLNGDTMSTIPREFWEAGLAAGRPIAGEPELGGLPCAETPWTSWSAAGWTPFGWGYFFNSTTYTGNTRLYDFAPGVDNMKFLEPKGRHLTHICDRWSKTRATAVQLAFFNGDGYVAWENIWGMFNRVTDFDAELIRRMGSILRWVGPRKLTQGYDAWVPHAPEVGRANGVFASRFESNGEVLWLLINRLEDSAATAPVKVPAELLKSHTFLDLYHGTVLLPDASGAVTVSVEALGIGAVLATKKPEEASDILQKMRDLSATPLGVHSAQWAVLTQEMERVDGGRVFEKVPENMVVLPRTVFNFSASGVEIEGGCDPNDDPNGVCCTDTSCVSGSGDCQCGMYGLEYFGVDVQFPWETQPNRNHRLSMVIGPVAIDKDLVTNEDYLKYVKATGYKPEDGYNWLKHWEQGKPKPGDERKPVVNVGLDEARAYCQWLGKRLPHTYEWQYGAQGTDGRKYPWGNDWSAEAVPADGPEPVEVGKHPKGDSPFGLRDMVGNAWQYTDSFTDDHTRAVILRGSSPYHPKVSNDFPSSPQYANWYFPPTYELNRHAKYFLMSPSYERAGTLGFRCAADMKGGAPGPYHYELPTKVQFV